MVQIIPFPALATLPDSTPKMRFTESITLVDRVGFEMSLSELLAEPAAQPGPDVDPIDKVQERVSPGSQCLNLQRMLFAEPEAGREVAATTDGPVALSPRMLEQQVVRAWNFNEPQCSKEHPPWPGRSPEDEPAKSDGPLAAEEESEQIELSVLEYPIPIAKDSPTNRGQEVGLELSQGDLAATARTRDAAITTLETTEREYLRASLPQPVETPSPLDNTGSGDTRGARAEAPASARFQLGQTLYADQANPSDSGSPVPKEPNTAPGLMGEAELAIQMPAHEPPVKPSQQVKSENAPVGPSAAALSSPSPADPSLSKSEDRTTKPAIEDSSNPSLVYPVQMTRSKPVISSPASTRTISPMTPLEGPAFPISGAGHPSKPVVERPFELDGPSPPSLDAPLGERQIVLSFEDGPDSAMNPMAVAEPQRLHHAQLDPAGLRPSFTEHIPRVIGLIAKAAQDLGERPVELLLNPEELGKVRMTLQSTDNGMAVQLTVERPETLDLLRRNIDLLANDLRQAGYDRLSFGFSGNDSFQRDPAPNQSGHQAAGQKPPEAATEAPQPILLTDSATGLDLRI